MTILVSDSFDALTFPVFRVAAGQGRSANNLWWVEQRDGVVNRAAYSGEWSANGTRCVALETRPGDFVLGGLSGIDSINNNARCDLGTYTTPLSRVVTDGEVWWWANSVYLPADWHQPVGQEWNTVFTFHGDGNNTHSLTIEQGQIRWKSRPVSTYAISKNITPADKNVAHHFKGKITWRSNTTGEVELWYRRDGDPAWIKKVDARAGGADATIQTCQNFTVEKHYLKIQNYHSNGLWYATGITRVLHDRIVVGTMETEVDFYPPPAAPNSMDLLKLSGGHVLLRFPGEPANGIQSLEFCSYDQFLDYVRDHGVAAAKAEPLTNIIEAVKATPSIDIDTIIPIVKVPVVKK